MATYGNSLAAKVTRSKISSQEMDQRLASADKGIAAVADRFVEWATADIAKALEEVGRLQAGGSDKTSLQTIFRIAHDLKGQGTTFDFTLVTKICAPFCDFLREGTGVPSADQLVVIKAHILALQAVLANNIRGEGGAAGSQLAAKLSAAIARVPAIS